VYIHLVRGYSYRKYSSVQRANASYLSMIVKPDRKAIASADSAAVWGSIASARLPQTRSMPSLQRAEISTAQHLALDLLWTGGVVVTPHDTSIGRCGMPGRHASRSSCFSPPEIFRTSLRRGVVGSAVNLTAATRRLETIDNHTWAAY
jgi:hypothetical protein